MSEARDWQARIASHVCTERCQVEPVTVTHQADEPSHKVTRTSDTWHGHGPTDGS